MLALLFPGQASQAVGMGVELRRASAAARRIFDLADEITGLPITRLCAEGPLDELTRTEVAQPAVMAASLAALAVLRDSLDLEPAATAGHSVGELAAYVAADVFDAETALQLVRVRAHAMAQACERVEGGMAAVIGLDEVALRRACSQVSENGSSVEVANLNAPGQLVVSGARAAIQRLSTAARAAGARRVMPLNVGGPFHSVYMRAAAGPLADALRRLELRSASVPVVLNATAEPTCEPGALRTELEVQVYSPVRWIESLEQMSLLGCDRYIEVGPGSVLAGLVKRTLPAATSAGFGSPADLPGVRALL